MEWKFILFSDLISSYTDSHELRELFSDVLMLRFKGYRQYYGKDSIPQDCYDFIGTHLIIASVENNKLTPRLVLRSITNDQSKCYNKDFPFLEHMFERGNEALKNSCEEFILSKNRVCYTNNYTIDPDLSNEDKKLLGEMILGFYYLYHKDMGIDTFITAASDKYKVFNTRLKQGYQYINNDPEYSTFSAPHIMDEKFRAMIMTEFSFESKLLGKKYLDLYTNRLDYIYKEKIAA